MNIGSMLLFVIFVLSPVQGQVLDDMPDDFLLITDNGSFYRMDINNNYSYSNIQTNVNPYGIDYDLIDAVILWTSGPLRQINSQSIYGDSQKTVRSLNGIAQPYGLAVDSISRLLFYTDAGNDIIAAISLEGSLLKTVIRSGLDSPGAIVTDPINGVIYWTDRGSKAKIEKSSYDGTHRQEVINTDLSNPTGLAIDIKAGVLYWCDAGTYKLERANVEGSNRQLVYQPLGTVYFNSIALHQSYLYYTESAQRSVMRIGKDGSGLTSVGPSAFRNITHMYAHTNGNGRLGINGCSNANGGCSHFCFPLTRCSKVCVCPDSMTLQPDGQTCRNDSLPDNFLLITDNSRNAIYRMDINHYSSVTLPLQNVVNPNGIDYDPIAAVIFWTGAELRQIYSGSIYGNSPTTVRHFSKYTVIYALAVDTVSRLLFFTQTNVISVISLYDYLQRSILGTDRYTALAIVADPINGTIYWTGGGKIEKANYDGTNRKELINTTLGNSFGLFVDSNAGVMYWCDYTMDKIERANTDGSDRRLIYQAQSREYLYSIALYESYLYYTDSVHSYVRRIGTDGSGMKPIGPSVSNSLKDIHLHTNISGDQGINGCSNGRGGCSYFCFPRPGGFKVCGCPDMMTLQPDGQTCRNPNLLDNFLLFTDSYGLIYGMGLSSYSLFYIALQDLVEPYAITYDPIYRVIFWTDLNRRQIVAGSIYGNSQNTIRLLNSNAVPRGIAVDALSRLIFYTDRGNKIIAVISMDGSMQKVVINVSLDLPDDILTHPTNGTIYWTDSGSHPKIEKSNYDGRNRQVLINNGLVLPHGLTIDIQAEVMYWCDAGTYKIERANVDGSKRQIVYQAQETVYFNRIVLYQSYLYYTVSEQRYLMRIRTDGSNLTNFANSYTAGDYSGIHLHTNGSGPLGTNGCSDRNGNCSHFCFPQPGGFKVCACPDDLILQPNGHTCGTSRTGSQSKPPTSSPEVTTYLSTIINTTSAAATCTIIESSTTSTTIIASKPTSLQTLIQNTTDVNECLRSPCEHGGNCTNTNGSFSCDCPIGWQGETCSADVNECLSSPCVHGGNCKNTNGTYSCECPICWQDQNSSTEACEELAILRAVVGSLAGLLLISVFLNFGMILKSRRSHQKKEHGPSHVNSNKKTTTEYYNMSENITTELGNVTEAYPTNSSLAAANESRSNEQGYTTLNISQGNGEHDYTYLN